MPLITPDTSEAPVRMEPGIYRARITEVAEFTTSKGGAALKVNWESAGNADAAKNGGRFNDLVMTQGKGIFRLYQLLEAVIGEKYEGQPFNTDSLIGREAEVVLEWQVDYRTNEVSDKYVSVKSIARLS